VEKHCEGSFEGDGVPMPVVLGQRIRRYTYTMRCHECSRRWSFVSTGMLHSMPKGWNGRGRPCSGRPPATVVPFEQPSLHG
jgi:hypothetical protein